MNKAKAMMLRSVEGTDVRDNHDMPAMEASLQPQ